jgi:hypothetical protein
MFAIDSAWLAMDSAQRASMWDLVCAMDSAQRVAKRVCAVSW